ncbi:MAG: NUDIX domain-containing protein [bacterium]|nr:NUDIX domain-containing protein [bacterium]
MKIDVLALDLEGTLISNAMSQIARPGLGEFLDFCAVSFPRVVIYTAVSEDRFRDIAQVLIDEGTVPAWFDSLEYVAWDGSVKDLRAIPDADPLRTLLVDDYPPYVHTSQRGQWIAVHPFDAPYTDEDDELGRVRAALEPMATRLSTPLLATGVLQRRTHRQASAIPCRSGPGGAEILLVTSNGGRWILPKGIVDPGDSPAQTAEQEALEEAGVVGTALAEPFAAYEYTKRAMRLWVLVYLLPVEQSLSDWDESRLRMRRWVTVDEALRLVDRHQIRAVIGRFAENPR